ncbi:putative non-specific serine/threonine protein kinase [Helianthus annuus]|nr:putative non-specific serine/threonine protein kinase [Helianthus annuus]KAJ0759564.1 putative non-specific serine/threonine protein kinase [Helianthus annuus]
MSDVYSFGVVLLEVLCRKPAVFVLKWLQLQDSVKDKRMEKSPEFSNRNSDDVSDSYLRNEIFPKSLKAYFGIAQRCLHRIPKQRPDMFEVVRCLESALAASQERITLQSTGSVNEVSFRGLNQATRGFSRDLLVSEGGGRRVFLGWVEKKTLAPLEEGVGTAVAVQWITSKIPQIHNEWLVSITKRGNRKMNQ